MSSNEDANNKKNQPSREFYTGEIHKLLAELIKRDKKHEELQKIIAKYKAEIANDVDDNEKKEK